jgi:hypothetical protein
VKFGNPCPSRVDRRTERLHQAVCPGEHCNRMDEVDDFDVGQAGPPEGGQVCGIGFAA